MQLKAITEEQKEGEGRGNRPSSVSPAGQPPQALHSHLPLPTSSHRCLFWDPPKADASQAERRLSALEITSLPNQENINFSAVPSRATICQGLRVVGVFFSFSRLNIQAAEISASLAAVTLRAPNPGSRRARGELGAAQGAAPHPSPTPPHP